MHWYKMVTGIEMIRYETKYRPNEDQKLSSKKPLVMIAVILIRCYIRTILNTLICLFIRCFISIWTMNWTVSERVFYTFTSGAPQATSQGPTCSRIFSQNWNPIACSSTLNPKPRPPRLHPAICGTAEQSTGNWCWKVHRLGCNPDRGTFSGGLSPAAFELATQIVG